MADVTREIKVAVPDESGGHAYLYVQAVADTESMAGGEQQVAGVVPSLDKALDSIKAVSTKVADSIKTIAPDKFSIEIGFEFKAEAGGLVAMLVRSGGSATVKVTLEWDRTQP